MNEHALQKMCVNWMKIQHRNLCVFAVPNGGKRKNGGYMTAEGMLKGVSDLVVMLPEGRVLFIELKRPDGKKYNHKTGNWNKKAGGKQEPSQKAFQDKCETLGHTYILIDTFDDFRNNITLWVDKLDNHS